MRLFWVIALIAGCLSGCQTSFQQQSGMWEAKGESNRYTNRFFLEIDSQHQVWFNDRRTSTYDLPVKWQQSGAALTFQSDSGYYFNGTRETDSTYSGMLVVHQDSFAVTFYPTTKSPFPGKPQEPRPPLPYTVMDVTYPSRDAGVVLSGTLTYPKSDGPFPTVILISGSGGQDRNSELLGHKPFLVQAHHYTQQGIAVLRFDDRGVGESTGKLATATSADLANDVKGAVDFLLLHPQVDTQAIYLIGHSEGGIIAPMVANAMPQVDGIVLLAGPAVPGHQLLLEQSVLLREAMGFDANSNKANTQLQSALFNLVIEGERGNWSNERLAEETRTYFSNLPDTTQEYLGITETLLDQLVGQTSSPWMRYFITYDPGEALSTLQVPVLALFGEKDLQVPPQQNKSVMEQLLKSAPTKAYTIRVYPSLNHLFQTAESGTTTEYAGLEETFNEQVLDDITQWILNQSK